MKYNIIYNDNFGRIDSLIKNNFSENFDHLNKYALELQLGEVLFKGDTFDGLELQKENTYSDEQINRFSFNEYEVYNTNETIKELTDCKFQFQLPLKIVEKRSFQTSTIQGNLTIALGNFSSEEDLIFKYDCFYKNRNYEIQGYSFEDLFENLKEIIKETHFIKNCYGCNYSDYNPFGNSSFGDMLCFKNTKEEYLKVKNKNGFFKLLSNRKEIYVQETYYCNEFEFRKENVGYRG